MKLSFGRITIKIDGIWFFPSLFRRLLDKQVRYFGEPVCGFKPHNILYSIDNDLTYFIRNHHPVNKEVQ